MAYGFHNRIKIIPAVHLNFSNRSVSTSIGVNEPNETFGKSGTHLNTSIPLVDIYNRQKLSYLNSQLQIYNQDRPSSRPGDIFNADIHEIANNNRYSITFSYSKGVKFVMIKLMCQKYHRLILTHAILFN